MSIRADRSSAGRRAEIYRAEAARRSYGEEIRQRYPDIPRRVSGYNLDDLLPEKGFHLARSLVGSESTCALTLGATLRLLPRPPARALMVLGYRTSPGQPTMWWRSARSARWRWRGSTVTVVEN